MQTIPSPSLPRKKSVEMEMLRLAVRCLEATCAASVNCQAIQDRASEWSKWCFVTIAEIKDNEVFLTSTIAPAIDAAISKLAEASVAKT